MKKTGMKRFLISLLTITVISLLTVGGFLLHASADEAEFANAVASVTKGGITSYYEDFNSAVTVWKNGGTLKLLKNASYSGILNIRPMYGFTASDYVLDLNGKTLNLESIQVGKNGSPNALRVGPTLTLEDSGEGGTVNITGCNMIDYGGLMILRGGTITGGNGTWGACFLLHIYGSLDMYDGVTLTGSTSNNFAGGVFVGSDSEFNMYGGLITGNSATNYGGGVVISDNDGAVFNLYGGTISGNTAAKGNGVAVLTGSFNIKGNAILTDGVYLASNKKINIGTTLSETPIGVTLQNGTGVFTSGWNTAMGSADPSKYFTSDNANYGVLLKDGEAEIDTKPHEHDGVTFAKWTSTNSLPTTAGNYYLAADVTLSSTWELPSGTTNLCLNGHGIKKTGTGSVIKVGEGRTLKIYDCDTTTEHRYSVASPATNGAGVATVNDALTSGYQTFTGGYITGGYITGGYQYGAGINLEGNGATLYMYGGTIIGNRLTAGSTGGGGVCVQDWDKSGGFYMYGGSIIGNTSNYGGGVYVRSGKMELIGGNISKNVANGNIGGGVLVFSGNSTLIVEGGSISDNKAVHGGAVEASGDGTVTISGGSFTNNIATDKGGALTNQRTDGNTSPASFNISGAPVFSGNTAGGSANDIYLCNTAVLNLTAELTNTTKIGITKASTTGAITSGWSTYMTDGEGKVADPADYFVSNNSNYVIKLDASGEAKIAPPHTHAWSYEAVGNVITATCTGTGTCDLTAQTITISATGKVYDGTAVTATVTKSTNWKTDVGLSDPSAVTYSGNTDAGTYTASVTVGDATAEIEFVIEPLTMTVTSSGYTGDYDGQSHGITVTVTVPTDATVKYGTVDGTYDLDENPTYTNAGTYTVYYQVTRKNYATVTGSETVQINKINATVFIVGNTVTIDYDDKAHVLEGYTATTDSDLYNVDADFNFNGHSIVVWFGVGIKYMGLEESQFENVNPNFAEVTFVITDGYLEIIPVDAEITVTPETSNPKYTGSEQALIVEGVADGGTLYYALGTDNENPPSDGDYSKTVPFAGEIGYYYVWYKVAGDANHNDLSPVCLIVLMSADGWSSIEGTLYGCDGATPIADALVSIVSGNQTVDTVMTDSDGKYRFFVQNGVYNVVAEEEQIIKTILIEVFDDTVENVVMPDSKTESRLNVDADDLGVAVGGLDREAYSVRENDNVPNDGNVSVVMTVEAKNETTAANAEQIIEAVGNKSFIFFDIKVEKTVDSLTTVIDETANVLEIAVPYDRVDRKGLTVYSYHGTSVKAFTESDSKANGTFRIDKENGIVYIYSNSFSTYAIGYTPYYRVDASLSFGLYNGTVTATLQNSDNLFKLENVNMGNIVFEDVPNGQYTLTITWDDGVANTLTMPVTVGKTAAVSSTDDGEKADDSGDSVAELDAENSPLDSTVDLRTVSFVGADVYADKYDECAEFAASYALVKTTGQKREETAPEPRRRDVFLV